MMNNDTLNRFGRKLGLDICCVGDVEPLKDLTTDPPELLADFTRVVVIGVHLSDWVFAHLSKGPTPLYQAQYLAANLFLDHAAFRIQSEIQRRRRRALAIPASQIIDKTDLRAAFFHQAAAISAGVGWVGKNFMVVHPRFGPRIKLASILTDLPLKPAKRFVSQKCGDCHACVNACPAGALSGVATETYYYESRSQALDVVKCVDYIKKAATQNPQITEMICGLCIAACPQGK